MVDLKYLLYGIAGQGEALGIDNLLEFVGLFGRCLREARRCDGLGYVGIPLSTK